MKTKKTKYGISTRLGLLALLAISPIFSIAFAQGTAFTYQGRLMSGTNATSGIYDFRFGIYDSTNLPGTLVAGPITNAATVVTNGYFFATLDFGAGVFTGAPRWLDIAVRTNDVASFTTLIPRQQLTPTPYALFASNTAALAGQAGNYYAPASGSTNYVAKNGDTMTGALNLPMNGLNVGSGQLVVSGGKLGIATTNPQCALHVAGTNLDTGFILGQRGDYGGYTALAMGVSAVTNGYAQISAIASAGSSFGNLILNRYGGNVGIGTISPVSSLQVNGGIIARGGAPGANGINNNGYAFSGNSGDNDSGMFSLADGQIEFFCNNKEYMRITAGGYVGIGTNNPAAELDVNGTMIANIVQIRGGSDVAEPFNISTKDIPKGAVVIIDDDNPGLLKMSDRSYDKRVAGIVSGANGIKPGLSLRQQGLMDGGENVALSGRVYALGDASAHPIRPGDLLTTSDTPGHCMSVTNPAQAQGAIIGKAMSSLKEGRGMVLVLVSLQ